MPLRKWLVKGSEEDLRYRQYQKYLKGPEWAAKRKAVIDRCNGICERCGHFSVNQVHHTTYVRLYDELLEDLEGLCLYCHEHEHGLREFGGDVVFEHQKRIDAQVERRRRMIETEKQWQDENPEALARLNPDGHTHEVTADFLRTLKILIANGVRFYVAKVSVSKRKWEPGVDLTIVEVDGDGGRRCCRLANVEQQLAEGTIRLDTKRNVWVVPIGCDLRYRPITKAAFGILERAEEEIEKLGLN